VNPVADNHRMRIVVMGAGIAGLSAALALGRRGHQVVVLEKDAHRPPERPGCAIETWPRPGVGHFHQPHNFLGAGRRVLRDHAPDVYARLLHTGAGEVDQAALLSGPPADGDEDLATIACRRPVFEAVLREAAAAEPTVQIAVGARVRGLVVERGRDGRVRVSGVRLTSTTVEADLIVDALGRTSPATGWLGQAAVELPPTLVSDCGIVYFSRHFRVRPGRSLPSGPYILGGPRGDLGYLAFATFIGDSGTFCIAIMVGAGDGELKKVLRHPVPYMAAAKALPGMAAWVDPDIAEPVSDVLPMGRIRNVFRPIASDGRPDINGYRPIGDAWIHTNATFAFGASLALSHGFSLAALLDGHGDVMTASEAFEAAHAADALQRWASVTAEDRDRARWWSGETIDPLDPASSMPLFLRFVVYPAATQDPAICRRVARRIDALDPIDALEADTVLLERARRIHHTLAASGQLPPPGRPERAELLAAVTAAQTGDRHPAGSARTR
jgi:NAD(P)-binding Rossmann-like domain